MNPADNRIDDDTPLSPNLNRNDRIKLVQKMNVGAFKIHKSCVIEGEKEKGLFANQNFEKNDLVGIYNGILCKYSELKDAFRSRKKYDLFLKKYNVKTTLSKKQTQNIMLKMSFRLNEYQVAVMPQYPIEETFYLLYNPMLYVNEPTDKKIVENPFVDNGEQNSKVNVLAFTNPEYNTVDYVASRSIKKGEEILVYYGNFYNRDYNVSTN